MTMTKGLHNQCVWLPIKMGIGIKLESEGPVLGIGEGKPAMNVEQS